MEGQPASAPPKTGKHNRASEHWRIDASYFLVAKVKIMIPGLLLMIGWLSYLHLPSLSEQRRPDRILRGRGPKANTFPDAPLGNRRKYFGVKPCANEREVIEKFLALPYQEPVRAGDFAGKTFVAACLASRFYDSFNPSKTLCPAPTNASVLDIPVAQLRKLRHNQGGFLPKDTVLQDKPSTCANTRQHAPPSPTITHHHSNFTACAASPQPRGRRFTPGMPSGSCSLPTRRSTFPLLSSNCPAERFVRFIVFRPVPHPRPCGAPR